MSTNFTYEKIVDSHLKLFLDAKIKFNDEKSYPQLHFELIAI